MVTLPATAPAKVVADTQAACRLVHTFILQSGWLTRFRGRPSALKGHVVKPPDFRPGGRRYPMVYWFHGYGGPTDNLTQFAAHFRQRMTRGTMPPMVWVIPDMMTSTGPSEFVDSSNNGPWDTALTSELVPYIDHTYWTEARPGEPSHLGARTGAHSLCSIARSALSIRLWWPTVYRKRRRARPLRYHRRADEDSVARFDPASMTGRSLVVGNTRA